MSKKEQIINIIEGEIQKFIDSIRPPIDIRDKVDIGYTFQNNALQIFEIRPRWDNRNKTIQTPIAKAKFVKSRGIWIVYWKRASGKWERYQPNPEVNELSLFFEVLVTDEYGCFWG